MNRLKKIFNNPDKRKSLLALFFAILVIIGLAFLLNKSLNRETLQAIVSRGGRWGMLLYYLIETAYITFTPFFNTFILIASGYIFGGAVGAVINFLAATSSLFLIVFLVKRYGRPLLKRVVSPKFYKHFDAITQKVGPIILLIAYVLPFTPDDELTYIVAAGPLKFKRFILPVLLGGIAKSAYSYIGDRGTGGLMIAIYFRVAMLLAGLLLVGLQEYILKKKYQIL